MIHVLRKVQNVGGFKFLAVFFLRFIFFSLLFFVSISNDFHFIFKDSSFVQLNYQSLRSFFLFDYICRAPQRHATTLVIIILFAKPLDYVCAYIIYIKIYPSNRVLNVFYDVNNENSCNRKMVYWLDRFKARIDAIFQLILLSIGGIRTGKKRQKIVNCWRNRD